MYNTQFQLIFNEPQGFQHNQGDLDFLELQDIFEVSIFKPQIDFSVSHNQEPQFQSFFGGNQNHKDSTHIEPAAEPFSQKSKKVFKSSYSKNVCYNICQKTIKVIKKGVFQQKIKQICNQFGVQTQKFKEQIVKRKKQFTGPKALESFLQKQNSQTKVFAAFMKWFLTEKYLRMAINEGEMKNLKIYIQFKNFHILPLLG